MLTNATDGGLNIHIKNFDQVDLFPTCVVQGTDGNWYTVGVEIVAGQPVLFLFSGGNTRISHGVRQIKADNGLWYSLQVQTVAGQQVLGLSDLGEP